MTSAERSSAGFGEEETSYLVAVSDMMVGLVFVFIIMLAAFGLSYRSAEEQATSTEERLLQQLEQVAAEKDRLAGERDQLAQERDLMARARDVMARERDRLEALADQLLENDRTRRKMLATVQDLLRERAVAITIDPENGVLRLPESLLFDTGSAQLRPAGARALREVAAVLARTLPCYSEAGDVQQLDCPIRPQPLLEAVLVEGHTDEVPIATANFRDNWHLGSARAINTYKALLDFEPSLIDLDNPRGEDLLGVSSYEAHRPVSTAPTEEGRRLNRRIDLRFLIAAPSETALDALRERVGTTGRP